MYGISCPVDRWRRKTDKKICALENKNFLDKTIKKVCNDKNEIISDQKETLSTVHAYYSNLFKNRNAELKNVDIDDLFKNQNIPKLTENQRLSIEGELKITEIGKALKNMKNEKTPGLDLCRIFHFFLAKIEILCTTLFKS